MKKSLRMIVCAMILFVLFANFSLAVATEVYDTTSIISESDEVVEVRNNYLGLMDEIKEEALDLVEKVVAFFILKMGEGLMYLIGVVAGEPLSIDALLFDTYNRTTLTFFQRDVGTEPGQFTKMNGLLDGGAIQAVDWIFDFFTDICVVVYLIILVYMGMRVLLLSTTADKKAKYKEVLFDWIKGVAILFLFPYVMKYIILLNHAFVTYIDESSADIISAESASISSVQGGLAGGSSYKPDSSGTDYMSVMKKQAEETNSIGDAICWFIMVVQIIQFLIVYMKRLITVMFLIAIFPLVTISYAIDKIGDGKSQAFDHWCKEFMLQVFTQSFHAINYVLVMGIVLQLDDTQWLFKIIGITYVAKGGDILKGMFAQMKGGGGGGTMQVAKAFVKTKAMMTAAKGIGKMASTMVGSKSLLGKGLNKFNEGRAERLEGRAAREELAAREAIRANSNPGTLPTMPTFNPDGTVRNTNLTDEQIGNALTTILNPNASDEEISKAANNLAGLSEEELGAALLNGGIPLGDSRRDEIESLVNCAAAATVLSNRRGASPIDVQTAVECVIREKKKGNSAVNKYLAQNDSLLNDARLRKIAGANSISVDREKINSRRAAEPDRTGESKEDRVRRAMTAIRTASNGEYSIEELHEHYNVVREAQNSNSKMKQLIRRESANMNYSLNDFYANLQVQTINNSAAAYSDENAQERVDQAIRFVKAEAKAGRNKEILDGLNADVNKLQEGYVPQLIDRQSAEKERLQKEFRKKFEEDKYSVDMGEEYDEYLRQKSHELNRKGTYDMLLGGATAAIGGAVLPTHVGVAIATAGVATGATVQDFGDLDKVILAVPNAVGMSEGILNRVENIPEAVKKERREFIDYIDLDPADKSKRLIEEEKRVSLDTNRKSMEINRKHYKEQAELDYTNRTISDRERERQRLLDRINKKAGDAADDK